MKILILILVGVMPVPLLAESFVAARTLPAGTLITESDLRSDADKDKGLSDPAQIIGLQTRITIYEGRVFQGSMLQQPVLVSRNQIVRLSFQRGPLRIITEGRALEDGAAGDLIRVMNLDSRATITARIAEDGTVHVAS